MITDATARLLIQIVNRVYDTEREHEEESIYWPDEREEWKRIVNKATREIKGAGRP
jgi:hypothetical protein